MSEGLRSRVAQFVIDVDDLDEGVRFWSAVLDAEETLCEDSRSIYRRLKLPDSKDPRPAPMHR